MNIVDRVVWSGLHPSDHSNLVLLGKAPAPREHFEGTVTNGTEEQPWNAQLPIDLTDEGVVTDVREEQPSKVYLPLS